MVTDQRLSITFIPTENLEHDRTVTRAFVHYFAMFLSLLATTRAVLTGWHYPGASYNYLRNNGQAPLTWHMIQLQCFHICPVF